MDFYHGKTQDGFPIETKPRMSPFALDGYCSDEEPARPTIKELVQTEGEKFAPNQWVMPRRSLANTYIVPSHGSSGDDGDGDEEGEEGQEGQGRKEGKEREEHQFGPGTLPLDFTAFDTTGDLAELLGLGKVNPSLSTRESSSSQRAHATQTDPQHATFSAYCHVSDTRVASGDGGESCCRKPAHPTFRAQDANVHDSNGASDNDHHDVETEDFVMVDGKEEEDEEEEMTDSCLNLVNHLDYVIFPTAEVLEFVRGGEMEVLEGVDNEEAACRRFLAEKPNDDNDKEAREAEVGEPGPKRVQVRRFLQDLSRRLHRLKDGC